VRRVGHEAQLALLVGLGDGVAGGDGGGAALRREAELVVREEARRLVDAPAQLVGISTPAPSCMAITWSTARSSRRLKSAAQSSPCSKPALPSCG
jgi:hypothetical protein